MRASHHSKLVCGALLLMASSAGCASLTGDPSKGKKKDSSWSWFKKKEYQFPQSINVTWSHDIFTAEGKIPTRGFGGRIYFYNEKNQAIPVDGELTVYGFDDTHRNHAGMGVESADKKFKFTAEQFTTHFSESDLGASYSIWIPWDQAPGESKKIMLIPTFKTKEGRLIKGNAASLLLPGPPGSEKFPEVIQASAKSSNSYPSPSLGSPQQLSTQPTSTQRTTTLQMPRHIQSRPQISADQAAAMLRQVYEAEQKSLQQHTSAAANPLLNADPAVATMQNNPANADVVLASASEAATSPNNSPWPAAHHQTVRPMEPAQWTNASSAQSLVPPMNPFPTSNTSMPGTSQAVSSARPRDDLETTHGPGWSVTQTRGSAMSLSNSRPIRRHPSGFANSDANGFIQPNGFAPSSAIQNNAAPAPATNDLP